MTYLGVSIVIPAFNAAETLATTLESVLAQSLPHWEIIIVNDGSWDDTATIATRFADKDSRLSLINQSQSGVSQARNQGIKQAKFDWLLFLDADDWLAPDFLEEMTHALSDHPEWAWVCCDWARVTPTGHLIPAGYTRGAEQLFPHLTRFCTFAIHACLVRKTLVEAVGGFNASLQTCEDWDLWQRIARTGALLGRVEKRLAYYRMRPHSASADARQLLNDAFRVIQQGHEPDARVVNPRPEFRDGQPIAQLAGAKLQWLAWAAGLLIGSGQDATGLLASLPLEIEPGLEAFSVAYSLFEAAILPTCQPLSAWSKLWDPFFPPTSAFLQQLERQSMAPGLARRSQLLLERLILDQLIVEQQVPEPSVTLGLIYAQAIEVTAPIAHLYLPSHRDRFYGYIKLEGELLGTIELPICHTWIPSEVLVDAIAAKFAWKILGRFFQHTLYPLMPAEEVSAFHDQIGWLTFLQQLWNRPDGSGESFYDVDYLAPAATQQQVEQQYLTLDLSQELPDLTVTSTELFLSVHLAGVPLGGVQVPVVEHRITAQAIRVALTLESGYELCVAVVREALMGQLLSRATSLRERLIEVAQYRKSIETADCLFPYAQSTPLDQALILGRHPGAFGTSVCRRALLPVKIAQELQSIAIARPELWRLSNPSAPEWVLYAPEFYTEETIRQHDQWQKNLPPTAPEKIKNTQQNRNHFETLFATQPDPWKYTSEYEQTKYEQTLSLLPRKKFDQVLELACAEGHFTVQLAPKAKHLVAADISHIALERSADRCQQFNHIDYRRLDLVRDELPGQFELIVCSEVLYYVGDQSDLEQVALKMTHALEPGGYLLMAHAHLVVDEPNQAGFDWMLPFGAKGIGDTFSQVPDLRLVKEIWTPLYRIQLFQRLPRFELPWQRSTPQRREFQEQPTPLPPQVAARVLWQGGKPESYAEPPITTARLPILMYHRVAPQGSGRMKRYRVTPNSFEQQLQYLQEAGYYSVTWETWRRAALTRCPLPGRAILLTFDDGYQDFYLHAAPLLKQYGFSATVFLVADQIGGSNAWDQAYQDEVPLMGWQEIRQLQAEGFEFGSHSCTHRPLTALPSSTVVMEGVRSRTILEQALGVSIQTIAYPYGDSDPSVRHLMGACGYLYGVSCESGFSSFQHDLLNLPRLEVWGTDTLRDFVRKLAV